MNLLADENVEQATVQWLRESGHDVLWASEDFASVLDEDLLSVSHLASRVFITRDLDFGQIIFRDRKPCVGIILIRLRARNQYERLALLQSWWPEIQACVVGHFVTVTNDRLRVRVIPAF